MKMVETIGALPTVICVTLGFAVGYFVAGLFSSVLDKIPAKSVAKFIFHTIAIIVMLFATLIFWLLFIVVQNS